MSGGTEGHREGTQVLCVWASGMLWTLLSSTGAHFTGVEAKLRPRLQWSVGVCPSFSTSPRSPALSHWDAPAELCSRHPGHSYAELAPWAAGAIVTGSQVFTPHLFCHSQQGEDGCPQGGLLGLVGAAAKGELSPPRPSWRGRLEPATVGAAPTTALPSPCCPEPGTRTPMGGTPWSPLASCPPFLLRL